jgi:hypothetical protein
LFDGVGDPPNCAPDGKNHDRGIIRQLQPAGQGYEGKINRREDTRQEQGLPRNYFSHFPLIWCSRIVKKLEQQAGAWIAIRVQRLRNQVGSPRSSGWKELLRYPKLPFRRAPRPGGLCPMFCTEACSQPGKDSRIG